MCKLLDPRLTDAEERYCVNIICFLSGDACNRAKIRTSGALRRLMLIVKNTKCDTVLSTVCMMNHWLLWVPIEFLLFYWQILKGLQSFQYDNISIYSMIKIGLVDVLIERLDSNTKELAEEHVKKSKPHCEVTLSKRLNDSFIEDNFKLKRMKIDYNPFLYVPVSWILVIW